MNKIFLIGNLGNDPEMSYTTKGLPVTKFRLAVYHLSRSGSGERQKETDWFTIVAQRQLAETCHAHLRKGYKVFVVGRLQQYKYTNKNGAKRVSLTVRLSEMEMIFPDGGKALERLDQYREAQQSYPQANEEIDDGCVARN